jgi:hypothetical protein
VRRGDLLSTAAERVKTWCGRPDGLPLLSALTVLGAALGFFIATFHGFAASEGKAHFDSSGWSYNSSSCSATVDPITVVFYGSANARRSFNHTEYHTRWRNHSGGTQYYLSHGVCDVETIWYRQTASACSTCVRYHIRFNQTNHSDPTWGTTTAGTPHYEVTGPVGCTHSVEANTTDNDGGFNKGREKIVELLGAHGGREPFYTVWPNTGPKRQCNGGYAWSNGTVAWLYIPSSTHFYFP